MEGYGSVQIITDPDPSSGGSKPYGSGTLLINLPRNLNQKGRRGSVLGMAGSWLAGCMVQLTARRFTSAHSCCCPADTRPQTAEFAACTKQRGNSKLFVTREYWMIFRGPSILAVVFGSSPPPFSRQQVVSLSQYFCVSPVALTVGRWGRRRAISYNRKKAWSSMHHNIISLFVIVVVQRATSLPGSRNY